MSRAVVYVLREALDLICTPERWEQGVSSDDTRMCIVAAVETARALVNRRDAVFIASQDVWPALRAAGVPDDAPGWNDAPERTYADVRSALERAIAAEEETS